MSNLENHLPTTLLKKVERIKRLFKNKRVMVALSGGIDSSTVALLAKKFAREAIAITFVSEIVPEDSLERAKSFCKEIGIKHIIINHPILELDEYTQNTQQRCYYCKNLFFGKLNELAKKLNIDLIVDGTNASDLIDCRFGISAAVKNDVVSPLAEAGLTKEEVRIIAKHLGIEWYDLPPESCYAMRIQVGIPITLKRIERIREAENFLKKRFGFKLVRVRDHGDLARIELLPEDLLNIKPASFPIIAKKLRSLGFKRVTLDLTGYHESLLKPHKV